MDQDSEYVVLRYTRAGYLSTWPGAEHKSQSLAEAEALAAERVLATGRPHWIAKVVGLVVPGAPVSVAASQIRKDAE